MRRDRASRDKKGESLHCEEWLAESLMFFASRPAWNYPAFEPPWRVAREGKEWPVPQGWRPTWPPEKNDNQSLWYWAQMPHRCPEQCWVQGRLGLLQAPVHALIDMDPQPFRAVSNLDLFGVMDPWIAGSHSVWHVSGQRSSIIFNKNNALQILVCTWNNSTPRP